MATIKEVAKYAGVSIGTVSNVINGKNVREDLRFAVEKAIRELNYIPHAVARSLKNSKTNDIALILPNLMDTYLTEFIQHTERILRENGYNITLYISNNIPDYENKAIEIVQQHKFDGVVLYSCQAGEEARLKELSQSDIPVVYLEKECLKRENLNLVAIDNCAAARDAVNHLAGLGHDRIALITNEASVSDLTLVKGYKESLHEHGIEPDAKLIRVVEPTRENAFKEMFTLIQMDNPPTAVILSNTAMTAGFFEAAYFNNVSIPGDISMISLSEKSWFRHGKTLHTSIERPVEEISRAVCSLLLENIRRPKMFEPEQHYIRSTLVIRGTCAPVKLAAERKAINRPMDKIKVLMLDSSAARSLKLLLPNFCTKYDLDAEIEMHEFKELYRLTENELVQKSPQFDVFMVDVSRINAMCRTGSLAAEEIPGGDFSREQFIEGLFESYCSVEGKNYGLPFMPGTQILFYRKDLFTDKELKTAYHRMFGTELRPPRNWLEFNRIASFFTRESNKASPTPYGITMAAKLPVFVTNEFCPRKWAYGARAFDDHGNVAINSSEALNALRNFIQSYSFAPPWALENDWDGEISDFCNGQCAMVIQYESHSTRISTEIRNELKGCVGYDVVPGGNPLLGGWSLVVNLHSKNKSGAFDFIKWACGNELAVPYSILGGTTARKSYYKSADLNVLYPWLDVAYRSYKLARKRSSPYRGGPTILKQGEYEDILGEEIKNAVTGATTPEQCLEKAAARLKWLVEQ